MTLSRREFLKAGGVLVVGAGLVDLASSSAGAQTLPNADRFLGKSLAADQVDSFLAIHADGSLTVFSGKVDMGTGGRIAMRQIVAEELDVQPDRIAMIEGDTALTPDQGSTAGSYGIARGGMQLRQAAATARRALLALAAPRLGRGLDQGRGDPGHARRHRCQRHPLLVFLQAWRRLSGLDAGEHRSRRPAVA